MRKSIYSLLAVAIVAATPGGSAAQSQYGDANAQPAPFNPQMGALMGMLIQPRHTKLGLAGQADNWPLAAYMLRELKGGFAVVAKAVPRWKGLPVPDLIEAAVDNPLRVVDAAIKVRSRSQFDEAYARLTDGCNACHATTDHSFVVIKVPDVSPYPNQEFGIKR